MIIDTHCHLNHSRFEVDLEETLARADNAGVDRMLVVGYNTATSQKAVELANRYPQLYASVGIHPHDAAEWNAAVESMVRSWLADPRVVALGEIGLDYFRDLSPRDIQQTVFEVQLEIAREFELPVIIHCRDAFDAVLTTLRSHDNQVSGVMHCWSGNPDDAAQIVSLGMHLGFGGTCTYTKAQNVRDSLRSVPVNRIILETDAPYLAPEPLRSKRNEPSYVTSVLERVSYELGMELDEVARITTQNAEQCFPRLAR